jgi:hypothetical protein
MYSNEPKINVREQVAFLASLLNHNAPLLAPPHVEEALSRVIHYFGLNGAPAICPEPKVQKSAAPVHHKDLEGLHIPPAGEPQSVTPTIPTATSTSSPLIRHNVYLTRQTTISTLYIYEDINVWMEYPETKTDRPIGYLFRRDPQDWQNPAYSFAYSLGSPAGQIKREDGGCPLLIGADGNQVPYTIKSATCTSSRLFLFFERDIDRISYLGQGVKVCPMLDPEIMKAIHVSASIRDVETRRRKDQQHYLDAAPPARDIFQKSLALISALQDLGCGAPVQEPTVLSEKERYFREKYAAHKMKTQRGHARFDMKATCEGRILLHNANGSKPYISYAIFFYLQFTYESLFLQLLFTSCEHYAIH